MKTDVSGCNANVSIAQSRWLALLGMLTAALLWPMHVSALPAPTSPEVITPYTAIASPVMAATAGASRPIGVGAAADERGDLTLQVQTGSLDVPMDAYFAIVAPRLAPGSMYLVNASGGLELFTGNLVPWKTNITSLNESLLGTIPLDLLPGGDYIFFLLLAPAGSNPLGGNYFLWSSTLTLRPTVEEFAEMMVDTFGTGTNGPLALLLGIDNGYSVQQIVDSVFAERFSADGVVLESTGAPVTSAQSPLGLISQDATESVTRRNAVRSVAITREALKNAIELLMAAALNDSQLTEAGATASIIVAFVITIVGDQLHVDDDVVLDSATFGALIGAIVESWVIIDPDADELIAFLDGPPDDPNSRPLNRGGGSDIFRESTDSDSCSENAFNADLLCGRELKVSVLFYFGEAWIRRNDHGTVTNDHSSWNGSQVFVGHVSGLGAQAENTFEPFDESDTSEQGKLSVFFNDDATAIEHISANYEYTFFGTGSFTRAALEGSGNLPMVDNSRPRPDDMLTWRSTYELTDAAVCAFLSSTVTSTRGEPNLTEVLSDYSCSAGASIRLTFTIAPPQ